MPVFLVSSVTPTLRSGAGLRSYGVTAALARHDAVEISYVVFGEARPAPEYEALSNVTTRPLHGSRGLRRGLEYLRARARGVPGLIARGVSPELSRAPHDAPADARMIADGPVVAAALLPLTKTREIVYLAHNLESGFRTEWGRGDIKSFERDVLRSFSESWMATRADVDAAVELGGAKVNARYVPNVINIGRIEPVAPSGLGRVLFVGDFTYEPNREGLGFLADRVMPLVWERRPEVRVSVVGRGLTDPPVEERIDVLGFVEDLGSAYAAADVVAVPLLQGGGAPLKFTEALAYGLPVVATDHAARLLEEGIPGEHFIAAGSPAEFAEALLLLLSDRARAREVGTAGRRVAARCYSIDTLAAILGS
jgi:glycosyltransferase involved in cell wall biosynthesis